LAPFEVSLHALNQAIGLPLVLRGRPELSHVGFQITQVTEHVVWKTSGTSKQTTEVVEWVTDDHRRGVPGP